MLKVGTIRGKYVVVSVLGTVDYSTHKYRYLARCECGTEKAVSEGSLWSAKRYGGGCRNCYSTNRPTRTKHAASRGKRPLDPDEVAEAPSNESTRRCRYCGVKLPASRYFHCTACVPASTQDELYAYGR